MNPERMTYGELIVEMDNAQIKMNEVNKWAALFPNERLGQYDIAAYRLKELRDEQYFRLRYAK